VVSSIPSSKPFASLMFLTSSTLFAASDLVDLFHSTATCRICLQGFLPLTRLSKARRSQPFPLVVVPMSPKSSCPLSPAPPDPPSGLWSRARIRSATHWLFTNMQGRSPLGFSSSRFSPETAFPCLHTFCHPAPCHTLVAVMRMIGLW
jgi:hypothetical protein